MHFFDRMGLGAGRLVAIGLVTFVVAACSSDDDASSGATLEEVVLTTQSWKASEFNALVVKNIAEREKLVPRVRLELIDEYEQWEKMAAGQVHVCMENWPSGHQEDIAKYINTGQIENLGALGAQAKIGWWVPTYMTVQDPSLRNWEAYKDPAKAALFKTAETGEKGRILLGDTTWVSNEQAIIDNLGLNLQITYAGGEEQLLAELENAYSKRAPILMQLWIPHAALTKYDMTPVTLKPYSAACFADASKIDCDYPPDVLFKTAWPQVRTRAPRFHSLVKNMQLSTKDQVDFLRAITVDGKTSEQAAADWVNANTITWQAWIAQ